MGQLIRRLLAFVAVAPLALGGAATASTSGASSPDEQAWAQAIAQNTLEAYATFAMDYPESGFAGEARARLVTASLSGEGAAIFTASGDAARASTPEFVPGSIMVV